MGADFEIGVGERLNRPRLPWRRCAGRRSGAVWPLVRQLAGSRRLPLALQQCGRRVPRHVKTGVYNTSDVLRPTVLVNGETGYKVKRGQLVRVDFTYENNGKNTQVVNTGWYISTNDLISTT